VFRPCTCVQTTHMCSDHAHVFRPCTCVHTTHMCSDHAHVFRPRTCVQSSDHAHVFRPCTCVQTTHMCSDHAHVFRINHAHVFRPRTCVQSSDHAQPAVFSFAVTLSPVQQPNLLSTASCTFFLHGSHLIQCSNHHTLMSELSEPINCGPRAE